MLCAGLVLVFVAMATAGDSRNYYGTYKGKCGNDGFYWRDQGSFVMCSNGNAYVQPCAPGSRNSGQAHFQSGKQYQYRDFCDVNLVDYGHAAKHAAYGYGYDNKHGGGYGDNKYGGGYGYGDNKYGGGYGDNKYGGGYGDNFYGLNNYNQGRYGYGANKGNYYPYRGQGGYGGYQTRQTYY